MSEKKEINNPFEQMLEQQVQVITTDGKIFVGVLKGIDQALNCVISDAEERVFSKEEGVKKIGMGLMVLRGDTVAILGELDPITDAHINYDNIKAEPLQPFQA